MFDTIIIGAGPAGMGAAVYSARSGLNTLLLDESVPGGLLNKISIVENYLGYKSVTGADLAVDMYNHVKHENVSFKLEKVVSIKEEDEYKIVTTTKGEYKTKGVIIAIGRKPRKSGIPNEEMYAGKGISYCAICDAPLYKGKKIVVLGGGDSAFEEAIYLGNFASSVTIVVRNKISASDALVSEAKEKNIEVIIGKEAIDFLGDETIKQVKFNDESTIDCDGVFIYYGYQADTAFMKDLNITDEKGYIEVDNSMRTKEPFIYACGDIIKKDIYQIVTAASDGCIAALSLKKDINKSEK
jgi:thioredoxin reductase (NADPH)